jgi:hypothetical protein
MTPQNAPFSQAEYDRRIALTRAAMAKAGLDAIFVTDPSNQAWLTGYDGWSFYVHQGVILTMEGRAALVGPPHGQPWCAAHLLDRPALDPRLCRQLCAVDRAPPDAGPCPHPARHGAGTGPRRGGDGELLLLGQGACGAGCGTAKGNACRCHRFGELAAPGEIGRRDRLHPQGRRDFRKDRADGHRPVAPGPAQERTGGRDHPRRADRRGRGLGRLSRHRAADPIGHGRHRRASDLERRADEGGRGDLLRTVGLLSSLPCSALPDRLSGPAPRRDAPRRRGADRRDRGRPCRRPRGQPDPRHRPGLHGCAEEIRHPPRGPDGLSDRPVLSARLGRTHRLDPHRGRDGSATRHGVSLHARALDGQLGVGDHRNHPDRRHRPGPGAVRRWNANCSSRSKPWTT